MDRKQKNLERSLGLTKPHEIQHDFSITWYLTTF